MNDSEIKYIEAEIKKVISSIETTFTQHIIDTEYEGGAEEEYPGSTRDWLKWRIKDLYYLILAYFEAKSMPKYMDAFQLKYDEIISNDKDILKKEQLDPDGFPELLIILNFKRFLDPFKVFDYLNNKVDELKKLTSILKNTDFILKNINIGYSSEPDIYKQIKWILTLYYPSCRHKNKASFIQEFKVYNPDILIPELKTAIEYKYIKDKRGNIDEFIDEIKVDSVNYTDDYRYENFIAVIYIKDASIATPESIEVAWKSKKFPANWELVTVIGS